MVLRGSMIVEIASMDLRVGDILYLEEDDEIPCDCVALYSSNPNGICYIQVRIHFPLDRRPPTSMAKPI